MSSKNKQGRKKTQCNDNTESEVFVLPPNLLEKLGINLGVIQNSNEITSEDNNKPENKEIGKSKALSAVIPQAKHIDSSISKFNENVNSHHPPSSILETAILMKKSVFLSPTFVSPVSSISGEIEISNVSSDCYTSFCENVSENDYVSNALNFSKRSPEKSSKDIDTVQKSSVILAQPKIQETSGKLTLNSPNENKRKKENSTCLILTNNDVSCESFKKPKVIIINEEIIIPSNKMRNLISPKTKNLIPVFLNTPVSKNTACKYQKPNASSKQFVISNENKELMDTEENLNNQYLPSDKACATKTVEEEKSEKIKIINNDDMIMTKHNEFAKPYLRSNSTQQVISATLPINNTDIGKKLEKTINKETNISKNSEHEPNGDENVLKNNLDSGINMRTTDSINKVYEIAEYLSEYHKDKQGRTKTKAHREEKISIQSQEDADILENILKTTSNVCRTYPSSKKQHRIISSSGIKLNFQCDRPDLLDTVPTVIDDISNDFCICHDFGYMNFYNDDKNYNHIHFWETKETKCTPQDIYSIYVDNSLNSDVVKEIPDILDLDNDLGSKYHSICFNSCNKALESASNIKPHSHTSLTVAPQRIIDSSFENVSNNSKMQTSEHFNSDEKENRDHKQICNVNNTLTSSLNKFKNDDKLPEDSVVVVQIIEDLSPKAICIETTETPVNDLVEIEIDLNNETENEANYKEHTKRNNCKTKDSFTRNNKKRRISNIKTLVEAKGEASDCSKNKHRKLSQKQDLVFDKTPKTENVECGVCNEKIKTSEWAKHEEEHCYIAWIAGENFDLECSSLKEKLNQRVKDGINLVCPFCNIERKYTKTFLSHINQCLDKGEPIETTDNQNDVEGNKNDEDELNKLSNFVVCAVCNENVHHSVWMHHLSKEHHYLAWKVGDQPVKMDDNDSVRQHLQSIVKENKMLLCSKCGIGRKYVKSYIQHVQQCVQVDVLPNPNDVSVNNSILDSSLKNYAKCGVCHKEVEENKWLLHMQIEHEYLAWKEGESELDVDDTTKVHEHLTMIGRNHGLSCNKCGTTRKYVKVYLDHVKSCTYESIKYETETACVDGKVECALCHKKIEVDDWRLHAMKEHYNVAWCVGFPPIDVKNPYEIEKYLKEYKKLRKTLVCNVCGTSRASYSGFFAHIITCGKTDEETEIYKATCDICNSKYLGIYKNQHVAFHREQEYAKLRKEKGADEKEKKEEEASPSGRRRAAQKAQSDIKKCNSNDFPHICEKCGFGTDLKRELKRHRCKVKIEIDLDVSSTFENAEMPDDEDSNDSDVDSNISDQEQQSEQPVKKRIKVPASFKIPKVPFKVPKIKSYLREAGSQFSAHYYNDDVIFSTWQSCEYQVVAEKQVQNYMPTLTESCKIQISDEDWFTLKTFNVNSSKSSVSIFSGGSIQCVSWAPDRCDDACHSTDNYLAVSCHRGSDTPRYGMDETPQHSGCLQMWNFKDMKGDAILDLCIAHDYGTVWGMDWCPSGVRDLLPEDDTKHIFRLGLLAIACSNGSAYILSVPYPSTFVRKPNLFYKLKPVAELRLSMNFEKKRYQATCIRWSSQKGHSMVLVGYSDGTVARYDLTTESPLLTWKESDMTVFYPYDDDRTHNMCITGLDLYPSLDRDIPDMVCCSSVTGAELSSVGGGGRVRVRMSTASAGAAFIPHWPSAMLIGDEAFMGQAVNEVDILGAARRLGAVGAAAACARCGHVVASAPPALRQGVLHAALADRWKQDIGVLEMKSFKPKRKVKLDEFAKKIEPFTYDDVIKQYGIRIELFDKKSLTVPKQDVQPPDRFPLADVTCMAFCRSRPHHTKIAVATHSGVLFLIDEG